MIIGFDTATQATVVACLDPASGEVAFRDAGEAPRRERARHTSDLLPAIEQAAAAAGGWAEVSRLAVGVGPGTFTGIRIGVVTGKALAIAHGCELAAVQTPHAIGARAARELDRACCAVLDGKRSEVFACMVASEGQIEWGPVVCSPPELAERLDAEGFDGPLAGEGAELYANELVGPSARIRPDTSLDPIDPAEVCRIGAGAPPVRPGELEPVYLRRPDAERWIARDS